MLSPTLQRVFDFVVQYKRMHDGNAPGVRDIQVGLLLSSTSLVAKYLNQLETLRLITQPKLKDGRNRQARVIEVTGGRWTYSPDELKWEKILEELDEENSNGAHPD